jgi:hypothetical protein
MSKAARQWDGDTGLVVVLAGLASVVAFLIYFRNGDILLFGDAVAHINIARRVFDSRTPGLLQLGTVWLPLPHLLMIPFVVPDSAWRTGIGGSLPSMAAYVFSVLGIFRLVRGAGLGRMTAWLAAAIFGLNPNLLYLQSTAMTETKCGACLLGACLTRYDGWFVAAAMAGLLAFLGIATRRDWKAAGWFLLLAWSGPVLWLTYNAVVYKNALEFANGPYSAKAIEQRVAVPGFPHPGTASLSVAGTYFGDFPVCPRSKGGFRPRPKTGSSPNGSVAALATFALLHAVGGVWQCAHLYSGVVAVFSVQRAVRNTVAAGAGSVSCGGGGSAGFAMWR